MAELILHHARASECRDVEGFKAEMAALVTQARKNSVTLEKVGGAQGCGSLLPGEPQRGSCGHCPLGVCAGTQGWKCLEGSTSPPASLLSPAPRLQPPLQRLQVADDSQGEAPGWEVLGSWQGQGIGWAFSTGASGPVLPSEQGSSRWSV